MSTSDFERLQNIAEVTIAVKQATGMQEQPVAQNRSANPTGNEVIAGDTIYSLENGKLVDYSNVYEDTGVLDE